MASPTSAMPPPLLPAYSLRVQLFAPNAYGEKDKPTRCFRVVTRPELTVREFCEEASRIHEINYGSPIAIKRVQDDQKFDITQNEILGSLFETMSTIRVVQSTTHPGVRESVPPTSALRFEPSASRKREREGSVGAYGTLPASNKRQRIDPDRPIPSRETETNGGVLNGIIPESPTSTARPSNGVFGSQRSARTIISGTPSPPPVSLNQFTPVHRLPDGQHNLQTSTNEAILPAAPKLSSPFGDAQDGLRLTPSRAKSASYHISRTTDRGVSVSTAATSPQSVEPQLPPHNRPNAASRQTRPSPILPRFSENRPSNEDRIYDNITSEDESSAIITARKALLKQKSSPRNGLTGTEWKARKHGTPPSGQRRTSTGRESNTPGALPLTPSSTERQARNQQKEIDEARRARAAAAEAAEQRRKEAEARQAEEARVAEEERAQQEEDERLDVENFQREEEERKAAVARAALLRQEKEAREKEDAEEEICRVEAENLLVREKAERERLETEKAAAAEDKRQRDVEKLRELKAQEEEKQREAQIKAGKSQLSSSSPEVDGSRKSPDSIIPKNTPMRIQTGTPFFPSGRKSILKSGSSQAARSSSPAGSSRSSERMSAGSIDAATPLSPKARRISFNPELQIAPAKILPPPRSSILPPPRSATPKKATNKPVAKTAIVQSSATPPRSSQTPILPPKRTSVGSRVSTPLGSKVVPSPQPPPTQSPRVSTPVLPPSRKERSKSSSIEPGSKKLPSPATQGASSEASGSKTEAGKKEDSKPADIPPPQKSILPPSKAVSKKSSALSSRAEAEKKELSKPAAKSASEESILPAQKTTSEIASVPSQTSSSCAEVRKKEISKPVIKPSSARGSILPAQKFVAKVATPSRNIAAPEPIFQESEDPEKDSSVEEQDIDEDETQSQNDSTRDSRSPISFSRQAKVAAAVPLPESEDGSENSSEDEKMEVEVSRVTSSSNEQASKVARAESKSDSENEEKDEEMEDAVDDALPPPRFVDSSLGAREDPMAISSDSGSDDESDEEMKDAPQEPEMVREDSPEVSDHDAAADSGSKANIREDVIEEDQRSEPGSPELPPHKASKAEMSKLDLTHDGKDSPSEQGSMSTQAEIDLQLTSDMHEVHTSSQPTNTPTPTSRPARRGKPHPLKVGASLIDLAQSQRVKRNSSQALAQSRKREAVDKFAADESEDGEEGRSSYDDDDESDSDGNTDIPAVPIKRPTSSDKSKVNRTKDYEDSGSNSSSEEDAEAAQRERVRKELLADVERLKSSNQTGISMPSPKAYRSGTQGEASTSKAKKPQSKRKADKYTNGFKFNLQ